MTWGGRGKTGTVNIQPEINGCAQTYGDSDAGDVFGIHEGVGLTEKRSCVGQEVAERCRLRWENKTSYKNSK